MIIRTDFMVVILNMYIRQEVENPKYLEKPDDDHNHNHNIEDGFDLVIHGDVPVDKP